MTNTKLLNSKIVLEGYTQRSLASKAKMSKNTLNAKINNRASFDTNEIELLCSLLHIYDPVEKCEIFLS